MLTPIPFASLGAADYGWLKPHYHFSFSNYYNPARMGFGALLVINDDTIAAGQGFPTHGHDNMEIITYVRRGAITHRDSLGNEGRTEAGDVQVMSAGTGVRHSEYNLESEETTLYQIWIQPHTRNVAPRWEAKQFPKVPVAEALTLLVSGREEDRTSGAAWIHQDAQIFGGRLQAATRLTHPIRHQAYLLVAEGTLLADGLRLGAGDGAEVTGQSQVTFLAETDAEILVIDVP